ncbi:MAG: hypothetical protein K6T68_11175, partial [Alicyclobacillus shizuokensis]|nr:hypothetical protein [Alicyclobacillus shizuokensis]
MQRAVELVSHGATLRGMEHIPDQAAETYPAVLLFHGFTGNRLEPHRMFLKISRMLEDELELRYPSVPYTFIKTLREDGRWCKNVGAGIQNCAQFMAQALEIPAVVGLDRATQEINPGDELIIDGILGRVILNPD